MAKLNRVCFTCGEKHSYCPNCYEDENLETWHIMFDNEKCKDIFEIINHYFYKHITIDEAIQRLESCDLSKIESFNNDIKNEIKNILSQKKIETVSTNFIKKKK